MAFAIVVCRLEHTWLQHPRPTKVNSVPSDAVASMIWPLTSSDGHTERAVKMKKKRRVDRLSLSGIRG